MCICVCVGNADNTAESKNIQGYGHMSILFQ